jgi:AcrR family transcriptional regulator
VAKSSKSDRKAAIVQASIELFIKYGVTETKMKQVAALAKVDQPLIHYYFPKADLLYLEVIEWVSNHAIEASAEVAKVETDPVKELTAYLVGTLDWARENPGLFSIWLYFYYLAAFNPTFSALNLKYNDVARQRIGLYIYKGLEKGIYRLPEGASVAEIALSIHGIILGNTIISATEGTVRAELFRAETLRSCFHLLGQ